MTAMPRQDEYSAVSAFDLLNVFAQGIDDLQNAVFGSVNRTRVPSCFLRLNAYRPAPTGTNIINWDAAVWDNDNMWSVVSPGLITCNTPGQWFTIMQLVYTPNNTGHRWGFVTKNGTNVQTNSEMFAGSSGVGQSSIGCVPVQLALGDVLRCYSDQDSGGALQLQNDYGGTKFGAIWIGP